MKFEKYSRNYKNINKYKEVFNEIKIIDITCI